MTAQRRTPEGRLRLPPDHPLAYLAIGFISMTGVFYVLVLPVFVGSLIDGAGFSQNDAGLISSANVYGSTFGGLLSVFLIRRLPWKQVVGLGLIGTFILDFASTWLSGFEVLAVARFLSGTLGGLVTGIIYGVIARVGYPTKAYAYMFMVTVILGGAGNYLMPYMVTAWGGETFFYTLMLCQLVSLVFLLVLSSYPIPQGGVLLRAGVAERFSLPVVLTLAAVFVFQATSMQFFAFMQRFGLNAGHSLEWISLCIAVGAWVGAVGTWLAIVVGTRFGRALPIGIAALMHMVAFVAYYYARIPEIFLLGSILQQIPWAFLLTYLLGMCADFDETGQVATIGGVMSKLGMASGPLAASLLLDEGSYIVLIYLGIGGTILTLVAGVVPGTLLDRAAPKLRTGHAQVAES